MRILSMLLTMSPVILGAAAVVVFSRTAFFRKHKAPIDGGKSFRGERIFGDHKTWIGLLSYVLFCTLAHLLTGGVCRLFGLEKMNQMYSLHANGFFYNLLAGALFGLAYALFELPNSFLKRRFHIAPGGHRKGFSGVFFFILDQIDSLLGCALVIGLLTDATLLALLQYVLLGAFVHVFVNLLLMLLHMRKSI